MPDYGNNPRNISAQSPDPPWSPHKKRGRKNSPSNILARDQWPKSLCASHIAEDYIRGVSGDSALVQAIMGGLSYPSKAPGT
jgi:hypothetical protein